MLKLQDFYYPKYKALEVINVSHVGSVFMVKVEDFYAPN